MHTGVKIKTLFIGFILLWILLFVLLLPYRSRIMGSLPYIKVDSESRRAIPHVSVSKKYNRNATTNNIMSRKNNKHVTTSKLLSGIDTARATVYIEKRRKSADSITVNQPKHRKHSSYGHCESEDFQQFKTANKTSMQYFTTDFNVTEEPIRSWLNTKRTLCDDSITVFADKFLLLRDVVINPRERVDADNLAKGGEKIQEVKSQNINKEDYIFKPGFLRVECNITKEIESLGTDLYKYLKNVQMFSENEYSRTENNFTIAIVRGDYANLWNHMFELYGVFILMVAFNKGPEEISILFLDGHPSCLLDKNWEHIFGPVQRVGRFTGPVLFNELIIGFAENQIPLSKYENPTCPYVEEFRTFVLNQYDIVEDAKKLNCSRLTFTFVIRRNQVYHPRNLEGNVERKIFNELEVIETLMENFPGVCIQALLMESIPMKAQLEIISETDVLIGMHGAGMMHATFLPRYAGIVELFPLDWRRTRIFSVMYEVLSLKWRKLKYEHWQNPDRQRQFSERVTIVDTDKVQEKVYDIFRQICPP